MDERKNKNEGLLGLAPRRKAAGYTQAAFSAALGIERGRYAYWETGTVWPSARWLPVMAELLGCTIAALYEKPPDGASDCHAAAAAPACNDGAAGDSVAPEGGEGHAGELPESVL